MCGAQDGRHVPAGGRLGTERVHALGTGDPGDEVKGECGDLPVAHAGDRPGVACRVHEPDEDGPPGELVHFGNGRGLDAEHDPGPVQQLGPAGRDLRTGGRIEFVRVICVRPRVVLDPDLVARLCKLLDDLRHGRHALFPLGRLPWDGNHQRHGRSTLYTR